MKKLGKWIPVTILALTVLLVQASLMGYYRGLQFASIKPTFPPPKIEVEQVVDFCLSMNGVVHCLVSDDGDTVIKPGSHKPSQAQEDSNPTTKIKHDQRSHDLDQRIEAMFAVTMERMAKNRGANE